jgi:hypothetical protein
MKMKTRDEAMKQLTPERQAKVRDRAIELMKAEQKKREERRGRDAIVSGDGAKSI